MEARVFELPPIATNAYLLMATETGEAVLFDAPMSAWETVKPELEKHGCRLTALLLTHGHWDHIVDTATIARTGVPVYGHQGDQELFENPSRMGGFMVPGLQVEACKIDHFLDDGGTLSLLGETVEVRHVPGHSDGSILFYLKSFNLAISGDAIFAGGVGRTDFPGCSAEILYTSIREKIYSLPDDTDLCPGHGPQTTPGHEKQSNPFVRA